MLPSPSYARHGATFWGAARIPVINKNVLQDSVSEYSKALVRLRSTHACGIDRLHKKGVILEVISRNASDKSFSCGEMVRHGAYNSSGRLERV